MDAVAVVAGTIIGSGIFLLPSGIAAQIPSLRAVLLVWAAGGALTVFGALSLAELGAMFTGDDPFGQHRRSGGGVRAVCGRREGT